MSAKIRTLKIIHIAICAGILLVYLFIGNISIEILDFPSIGSSSSVYLFIPVAAFALGNILFNQQLKQVDRTLPLEDNFGTYQTASIIRWAILEGAAFLILFLAPQFTLFGLFIIIYMIFLRPTEDKMKTDLQYLD